MSAIHFPEKSSPIQAVQLWGFAFNAYVLLFLYFYIGMM